MKAHVLKKKKERQPCCKIIGYREIISTKGVDKNMLVREILHVLKDNDLSLNIWFKRRDMGYAKGLKKQKIYGHIKGQV